MITQTLDLNLIPGRVLPLVNVSQYDKDSRTLEFTIYNGDQTFDLTGLSAYIQGLKPDGHGFNYSANISAGKITADITEQMTAVSGRVMCEVIIMDGTDRIGTGNFILNVERAAMPDNADMSASEYSYIQELIEDAQAAQTAAEESAEDAEAWAVGKRNGTDVPATDPTYQNNAKYYADQAQIYAQGALKYKGSVLFANIPTTGMTEGDMYNIEDDFTTDNRFQEGAGIEVAAGSNIAWNANNKWDVLAVVAPGVASFNGRTGAVTPESGDYDITDISATGGSEGQIPMVDSNGDIALTDLPDTDIKSAKNASLAALTFPGSCLLTTHYGMSEQNGTPTPSSPVAITNAKANYRDCGKNLFPISSFSTQTVNGITFTNNNDGTWGISGTNDGTNVSSKTILAFDDKAEGMKVNCSSQYAYRIRYQVSKNDSTYIGEQLFYDSTVIVAFPSGSTYASIQLNVNKNVAITGTETVYPIMTLPDVTDSTYEPYNGEEINTNLTLRAIEVTSSDDYNLVKDGKYYIADTLEKIDGGYQITRRIGTQTGGTVDWWGDRTTAQQMNITLVNPARTNRPNLLSNMFIRTTNTTDYTDGKIFLATSGQQICCLVADASITSKATAQTWVDTNNPIFVYPLATPTTEAVSSENAKKLLSLKSHETSTYISQTEDTEGVMVIEYPTSELTSKALTGYVKAEKNGILLDEFLCGQTTAGTYSVSATVDANEKVTYAWT